MWERVTEGAAWWRWLAQTDNFLDSVDHCFDVSTLFPLFAQDVQLSKELPTAGFCHVEWLAIPRGTVLPPLDEEIPSLEDVWSLFRLLNRIKVQAFEIPQGFSNTDNLLELVQAESSREVRFVEVELSVDGLKD